MAPDFSEYDGIELSEEEQLNAIRYFKMLKSRKISEDQRREEKRLKILKAQAPWTYDELKADVLTRAEALPFAFQLDRDNEKVFHILCLYFSGDPRLAQFGSKSGTGEFTPYNHKKGIALVSETKGTGKSILMQLFSRNKKRPFICIPTLDIANEFSKHQEAAIAQFSTFLYIPQQPVFFYCQNVGICYEDLGMEERKNNYGNKSDVMLDILFKLYEGGKKDLDWSGFHLTSNLNGAEFEQRYDDRMRSRMRQMFNFIELPGKDRRK